MCFIREIADQTSIELGAARGLSLIGRIVITQISIPIGMLVD